MPQNLDKLLRDVCDEPSFIRFVEALAADFAEECEFERQKPSSPYGRGALGWENGTIDAFLDAAASWGASSALNPGDRTSVQNPWYRCAHMLYAGKYYE